MPDQTKELAELRAEIERLKARLPPPPAPPAPPKPVPGMAPQGDYGMHYGGPPSAASGGESWVKERRPDGSWKDPNSGQWRYASGEFVPVAPAPPIRLQQRTPEHEMAVRLSDAIIARWTPREG